MYPMTPLQSWIFMSILGILVYIVCSFFLDKLEKNIWEERIRDDEDINI